jgi:hypothetical protein
MAGRLEPEFNPETNTLVFPKNQWATYTVNGERVKGTVVITESTVVTAEPVPPARFREGTPTSWTYSPNTAPATVEASAAEQIEAARKSE